MTKPCQHGTGRVIVLRFAFERQVRAFAALLLAVIALHAIPVSAIAPARASGAAFSAATSDVAVLDRRVGLGAPQPETRPAPLPLQVPVAQIAVPADEAQTQPPNRADRQQDVPLSASYLRPATPARAPPKS